MGFLRGESAMGREEDAHVLFTFLLEGIVDIHPSYARLAYEVPIRLCSRHRYFHQEQ